MEAAPDLLKEGAMYLFRIGKLSVGIAVGAAVALAASPALAVGA
jgi:hypothetical protein